VAGAFFCAHEERKPRHAASGGRALIADSEALGFRQMIAVIGDTGNIGSIELHGAAGFRMAWSARSQMPATSSAGGWTVL
jgi:L-amino acid N-acyltransferase YncA